MTSNVNEIEDLKQRLKNAYEKKAECMDDANRLRTELTTLLQRCEKAEADLAEAQRYATNLCTAIVSEHYPENTEWRPLPSLGGVLSQIDNASTGLVNRERLELAERQRDEARKALEPFARIEPVSISLLGGEHISSDAFRAARKLVERAEKAEARVAELEAKHG